MKEQLGDIWQFQTIVIPTNGKVITLFGTHYAEMGRGLALQAVAHHTSLDRDLAVQLLKTGNHCYLFHYPPRKLITFPTQQTLYSGGDLKLIAQSAQELTQIANTHHLTQVYLPCVGCGNGRLRWFSEVRPVLRHYLDDRFTVVRNWGKE